MNEEVFKGVVRSATHKDKKDLPILSYTGMETFKNCPYQFDIRYNNHKRADNETTIALEMGNVVHRVLEEKAKCVINDLPVNYDDLTFMLNYGVTETDKKTKEKILGITDLKKKYFEEWFEADSASGMNYTDKIKLFENVIKEEMKDISIWKPVYAELPFEFVYKDKIVFKGFIDRVDINKDGDYRVIDYKTSKRSYRQEKLSTSLQFGIYALAIYYMFGRIPTEYLYRFVLIDESQEAMTKGWEKRLIKNIDKVLGKIESNKESGMWVPNPTPLCYWCSYCATNPKAQQYKNECEYYSLWTPNNKKWEVNKRFNALDSAKNKDVNNTDDKQQRKLIF